MLDATFLFHHLVSCTWSNLTQVRSQYLYSSMFPWMGLCGWKSESPSIWYLLVTVRIDVQNPQRSDDVPGKKLGQPSVWLHLVHWMRSTSKSPAPGAHFTFILSPPGARPESAPIPLLPHSFLSSLMPLWWKGNPDTGWTGATVSSNSNPAQTTGMRVVQVKLDAVCVYWSSFLNHQEKKCKVKLYLYMRNSGRCWCLCW